MQGSLQRVFGLTGARLVSSFRINTLYFEETHLGAALRDHCKQLLVHTADDAFPYRLLGSGTCVSVKDRSFMLCCGHQIDEVSPDDVTIAGAGLTVTASASQLFAPTITQDNADSDWIDARAFEYVTANYPIANFERSFFTISEDEIWPSRSTDRFVVLGYPSERQDYDFENGRIRAHVVIAWANYVGPTGSPHLHRIRLDRTEAFAADGMSGGAVFHVGGAAPDHFIGFAGMIQRGSATSDDLYLLDARMLLDMCEMAGGSSADPSAVSPE